MDGSAMSRTIPSTILLTVTIALAVTIAIVGCFDPQDQRPGLLLRGETLAAPPSDWAFTNEHREIAVEVRLVPLDDAERIASVRVAYAAKYDLPTAAAGSGPEIRYWRVESRS